MPKSSLRRQLLAQRRALTAEERRRASDAAQERLLALPEFRAAATLALYMPVHHELATEQVLATALAEGRTVVLPVVCNGALLFRRVSSLAELVSGSFGILEPPPIAVQVAVTGIDLFVVPGVAFDEQGHRIGYGKGFYDRALHPLEGSGRLLGFGYDFQLVPQIVGEPHDVRLDVVVTERRVHRCTDLS